MSDKQAPTDHVPTDHVPTDQAAETTPGPETTDPIDGVDQDPTTESADTGNDTATATGNDTATGTGTGDEDEGESGLSPLERLQAEKDHLTDVLARTQAEFANYRKRMARDQSQLQDRAKATVLEAFIPALDALDSAAGHDDGLIGPVRKVVADTAARIGLERFEPELGDRFDPTQHEAIAAPDTGAEAELVVDCVVRPGYRIGSRLLRAAEVTVAAP